MAAASGRTLKAGRLVGQAGQYQGTSRGRKPGRRPSRKALPQTWTLPLRWGAWSRPPEVPGSVIPGDMHMGTRPSQRWGRLCVFLELCSFLGSWAITLDTLTVSQQCPAVLTIHRRHPDVLTVLWHCPDALSIRWQCPAEASAAGVRRRKGEGGQSSCTGCFHPYSCLYTAQRIKPRVP